MKLTGSILRQSDFGAALTAELYQIYAAYYAPTSLAMFARDLASKAYAIIVRTPDGRVCGFSTVARLRISAEGREVEVLFSGDTVVERPHWGEQTLPFRWIEEAGRIKSERPDVPLYWLLITKGHRTFRYLPGFAKTYCPGPHQNLRALRDAIAGQVFGGRFDARTGILRPDPDCPTALRPEFAGLDAARIDNPHVRAFLSQNPGHAGGDELVCLCALSAENLRPRARRQFLKGMG
ncbi:MAG: hypothetical protein HC844_20805 [Tabrizicola sp.]|nr:hypothetical protein [Tabrizicola sp.]